MKYVEKTPTEKRMREVLEFAKKYPNSMNLYYWSSKSTRDRDMLKLALQKLAVDYGVVLHISNEDVPTTIRPVLKVRTNHDLPMPKV